MAINVSVQYNGGLLPDIILLTQGNPIKCPEEVLSLQSMIPPKRFDIFPRVGCSEGLDASRFLFRQHLCRILRTIYSVAHYQQVLQ